MLKAEAINQAYAQIRISGLTATQVPEEEILALRELDQMMAQWQVQGRTVNYNFPPASVDGNMTQSDPNEILGVHAWALTGVIANLSVRLVEYFGKEIPQTLGGKARAGLNVIRQQTFKSDDVQYPHRMPIGSGNQLRRLGYIARFYYPVYRGRHQTTEIITTQNLDLQYDFTSDMKADDYVVSYSLIASEQGGIELESDELVGNVVKYRVLAYRDRDGRVDITATSASGLVMPKTICFDTVQNSCCVSEGVYPDA